MNRNDQNVKDVLSSWMDTDWPSVSLLLVQLLWKVIPIIPVSTVVVVISLLWALDRFKKSRFSISRVEEKRVLDWVLTDSFGKPNAVFGNNGWV